MSETDRMVEQHVPDDEVPQGEEPVVAESPAGDSIHRRAFQLKRPATAHVAGVVLMIFAVFGILALIGLLILLANAQIKTLGLLTLVGSLIAITLISIAVHAVMGVGLLRLAPWARTSTLVALPTLLVFNAVVNGFVLFSEAPILHRPMPGVSSEFTPGVLMFLAIVAYAFALFIGLLVTLNVLFFLTRSEAVEAFKQQGNAK